MRKFTNYFLAACVTMIFAYNARAAIYTATSSGNYSSTTTWLGGVPPPVQLGGDNVIINSGVTITLDRNIELNTNFALLQLKGTAKIQSTGKNYIALTAAGIISGDAGSVIDIDSVYIGGGVSIQYSGTIAANTIALGLCTLPANLSVTAKNTLRLALNTATLNTGTTLILGTGGPTPTLVRENGNLTINSGANFNLSTPYHLRYESGVLGIGSGFELSGSGLVDIEIAIPTATIIGLSADLTVKVPLLLTSGSLGLNTGYKLNIAGNSSFPAGGTGNIWADNTSEINITSSATNLGEVKFAPGHAMVKNMTMSAAGGNAAILKLGSGMEVTSQLDLQSGLINVQANTLSINSTSGSITGGSGNSFIITESNGYLKQDVAPDDSLIYPVGYKGAYTPVKITGLNGNGTPAMGLNVTQGVKAQGTTGTDLSTTAPLVSATWTTNMPGNPTNLDYRLELMWEASAEVNGFNRNKSFVTQYSSGNWSKSATSAASSNGSLYAARKDNISSTGTFAVFDENTLGVDDVVSNSNLHIFPNPANNILHIDLNAPAQATIYNATGNVVNTSDLNSNNNTINISMLPTGVYCIYIEGEDTHATGKFIKL